MKGLLFPWSGAALSRSSTNSYHVSITLIKASVVKILHIHYLNCNHFPIFRYYDLHKYSASSVLSPWPKKYYALVMGANLSLIPIQNNIWLYANEVVPQ
jgi:hypothetical protein